MAIKLQTEWKSRNKYELACHEMRDWKAMLMIIRWVMVADLMTIVIVNSNYTAPPTLSMSALSYIINKEKEEGICRKQRMIAVQHDWKTQIKWKVTVTN